MEEGSAMKCTWCEEELNEEQAKYPRRNSEDQVICDDCYNDEYAYTCCLCADYEETDYQGSIGSIIVVVEEIRGFKFAVLPGLYEIIKHPYFADGMIEGYLFNESIRRIGDVPREVDTDSFPCGHLCRECVDTIKDSVKHNEEVEL